MIILSIKINNLRDFLDITKVSRKGQKDYVSMKLSGNPIFMRHPYL